MRRPASRPHALVAAALLVSTSVVSAQTLTWDGDDQPGITNLSNNWFATNVWFDGSNNVSFTDGASIVVTQHTADVNLSLNGNAVINNATLDVAAGFTSRIQDAGGALTLNGVMTKTGPGQFQLNPVTPLTGPGSIVINEGRLRMPDRFSTFTGGVTLNAGGDLEIRGSTGATSPPTFGSLGTGTLTINGGTLRSNGNSDVYNAVSLNGDVTVAGGAWVNLYGPVDLGSGMRTITNNNTHNSVAGLGGRSFRIAGTITGSGGIIIGPATGNYTGLGGGASTFSGGVIVKPGGTLSIDSGFSSALGSPLDVGTPGNVVSGRLGTGVLTIEGGRIAADYNESIYNNVVIAGDFQFAHQRQSGGTGLKIDAATIDLGNSTRTIEVANTSANTSTNFNFFLNGEIRGDAGVGITYNASGSNAVKRISYSGTLANTYSGPTTVNGIELRLQKPNGTNALAGDLIVNSGTVRLMNANQIADGSAVMLNGGAIQFYDTTGNARSESVGRLEINGGLLDLATYNTNTSSQAVAGMIVGGGPNLANVVSIGTGGTLAGSGTVRGTAFLTPGDTSPTQIDLAVGLRGGGRIAPGPLAGGIGTLTVGQLEVVSGELLFDLGNAVSDRLVVSQAQGLLTTGFAFFAFNDLGVTAGTYTLLDYSGTPISNFFTHFGLAAPTLGSFGLELVNNTDNTSIDLIVSAGVATPEWAVDADGNWSAGSNWTTGSSPNGPAASATLGAIASAPRTVTLDVDVTLNALTVETGSYVLDSAGAPRLNVATLDVASGRLALDDSGTTSSAVVAGTVNVASGAVLHLKDGALVIDYAAEASPMTATIAAVLDGRITADAQAVGSAEASALAVSSFGGVSVDATSVLLLGTLKGDTNLDRTVDFADLLALAQGFSAAGTWINGDSDYSGLVDFTDLLALAQNFGATALSDGSMVFDRDLHNTFEVHLAQAFALVPEPGTMALLLLAPLGGLIRRR